MKRSNLSYIILAIGIFLTNLLSFKVFANDNTALYLAAQEAYKKQDYTKAINDYQKILHNEVYAAEIFYNLGNCYYKVDSIGKAIQYYEKARKLIGDDDDLMYNLKLAQSKTVDKIEPIPEFIVTSTWKNILNYNSADRWAYLVLLNFALMFLALIVFQISKKPILKKTFFSFAMVMGVLTFLFFILAKNRAEADKRINKGVLITGVYTVKSAPNNTSTDLFVIHEGTMFKIVEYENDWLKIKLDNGNQGWVIKKEVGQI
ncbi:MAG: tetratricopeptide repeat protein [Bacteroidia bacterium]|nr:tetratricopeptide repeat protein [Bacteroidia bacterium]MCZ2249187.1 tetratricopeptide repeat protein [Bacteroidia bacterium]